MLLSVSNRAFTEEEKGVLSVYMRVEEEKFEFSHTSSTLPLCIYRM